jgi:hypothetical protein
MKTPVVLIIFKRPDTTEKVFEAIRQAKPTKLFVIADGARSDRFGEDEKCKATRAIIEQVDWECEVIKNYSDTNLGCPMRVSSGLNWVFEQVEEAIILEDDCIPHPTFFQFCEELLEKYRHDTRIASISGTNFQFAHKRTDYSYYFSIYNHCWGWATWRRSWQQFDLYVKQWSEIKAGYFLSGILNDSQAVRYWSKTFESVYENPLGIAWDYQFTFACWINNCLSIIPNENLITNIGYGIDSTNFTSTSNNPVFNMPIQAIDFPLQHPAFIMQHIQADNYTQKTLFKESIFQEFKQQMKILFKI